MARKEVSRRREEFPIERGTGVAFNRLWEELAKEAERYVSLVRQLKDMDIPTPAVST